MGRADRANSRLTRIVIRLLQSVRPTQKSPRASREHLSKYLIRKGRKFSLQWLNGPSSAIAVTAAISSYIGTYWGIRLAKGIGQRRHKRIKVVLPVRISGKDAANNPVNELAHTLDITPNGA